MFRSDQEAPIKETAPIPSGWRRRPEPLANGGMGSKWTRDFSALCIVSFQERWTVLARLCFCGAGFCFSGRR
jgi:hypothetical protein